MKKCFSLLAILGLLLLVGNVFAVAPIFNDLPDLKLFVTTQGLTPAFDLADFNSGDVATSYSITAPGLGLASLTGSSVNQASYGAVTVDNVTYQADNAGGPGQQSNKSKYATYKINKLPKVGLNVGESFTINMANYASNAAGPAIPTSFGSPDAITISDTTKVSAVWSGNNIVITSLAAASGPVDVFVTAAPIASAPYGSDQDKEVIEVNSNLISGMSFASSADTANFGLEIAGGKTALPGIAYVASVNDGAGVPSDGGVYQFNATNNTQGVKATLIQSKWISMSSTVWYTVRAKVAATLGTSADQFILFGFNGNPGVDAHVDIAANAYLGTPTTWTWVETPIQAFASGANGYPQFQFKNNSAGADTLNLDEVQLVQAAPTLVDASRGNTRLHYPSGDFDAGADTTGWGQELYGGSVAFPGITVANGLLTLNFSASPASKQGIKWTAIVSPGNIYTPAVTAGREVGTRVKFDYTPGTFATGIVLAAAYGVLTNGQGDISIGPNNLVAAAQTGTLINGELRTAGKATNPFYQFQFGIRGDGSGVVNVDNVDFDKDTDDPNFGDGSLFP